MSADHLVVTSQGLEVDVERCFRDGLYRLEAASVPTIATLTLAVAVNDGEPFDPADNLLHWCKIDDLLRRIVGQVGGEDGRALAELFGLAQPRGLGIGKRLDRAAEHIDGIANGEVLRRSPRLGVYKMILATELVRCANTCGVLGAPSAPSHPD